MFDLKRGALTSLVSIVILSGCGGGDGAPAADGDAPAGGGGGTPVASAGTVSGTAGTGSPVVNGAVTVTDSSLPTAVSLMATTDGAGNFTVEGTDELTFPVRITVEFAEGGAQRTLRSIAVNEIEGETTVANINPITDVIAGTVENIADVTTLTTEITRLSQVLANLLSNYGVGTDVDFLGGEYTADPTDPVDNALDMVNVALDGTGANIVLQSTADPTINTTVPAENTTPEQASMSTLAETPNTTSADPIDVKALIDAFGADLAKGQALTAADLNDVFHADYQDDDGFSQAQLAEGIAEEAATDNLELTVVGYKILRCFEDATVSGVAITDKCYVRALFTSPSIANEDFGGTPGEAIVADFFDLIAERRDGGDLKFSGGFFKPFSAQIKLFNSNIVNVGEQGVVQSTEPVQKGLSLQALVTPVGFAGDPEPEQAANSNLQTLQLVNGGGVLMSVTRSGIDPDTGMPECQGANGRLNIDPSGSDINPPDCGNQSFEPFVDSVAQQSANKQISAVFIASDNSPNVVIPNVRIVDPSSSAISSFGTLNQASLQALRNYAEGNGTSVQITLTPPAGANFICISDGGNNEDLCTYSSRQVTIPENRLNRTSGYFIITRDAENNTFQRQYILNDLMFPQQ